MAAKHVSLPGVRIEVRSETAAAFGGISTSAAVFIGAARKGPFVQPVEAGHFQDFSKRFGEVDSAFHLGFAVHQFFQNGGREAQIIRIRPSLTARDWTNGLDAIASVKSFDLLVLPGATRKGLLRKAADICEKRRAFFIADAPDTTKTQADMIKAVKTKRFPESGFVALYYPWLTVVDPSRPGKTRLCPPSGTMAGLYAKTDLERGVWKAPAGLTALRNVVAPAQTLTAGEHEEMNRLGINVLRQQPDGSVVCWGAKTLNVRTSNEFAYVTVRRLTNFIEMNLLRGFRWVCFQPLTDPKLWIRIRSNAEAFMSNLWRQGAFAGNSQDEAFNVRCGLGVTMTRSDLDNGRLLLEVAFAPVKPAEFVIVRLNLTSD